MERALNTYLYKKRIMKQFEEDKNLKDAQLVKYLNHQFEDLDSLVNNISKENFWENVQKFIGIDSKLQLLRFAVSYRMFEWESVDQILSDIETDYKYINQELYGYRLNEEAPLSIIFEAL